LKSPTAKIEPGPIVFCLPINQRNLVVKWWVE
jgi:hypothetical protein